MPKVHKNSLLTFIKKTTGGANPKALYLCKCGNTKELQINNVGSGITKSCGCIRKKVTIERFTTHGLRQHPLYRTWSCMLTRCYNKNTKSYSLYGGRGVVVCDEWRTDFKAFYDWAMANGWQKGLALDKDKKAQEIGIQSRTYSPEFCQFLTAKENTRFRSATKWIEYNGEKRTMSEWAAIKGMSTQNIYTRLKAGWEMERIMNTPVISNKK